MSDQEPLTPELKGLEAALASLTPTPLAVADRDRLMFAAGRAERIRAQRMNFGGAAVLVAALTIMTIWVQKPRSEPPTQQQAGTLIRVPPGASVVFEHDNQERVRIRVPSMDEVPSSFSIADLASPTSYFQLRRQLNSLDAVTADAAPPSSSVAPASSPQALFHELLN